MNHFLITRFNLKVPDWELSRSGNKILTEEWLSQRLELFVTYCLPSVVNQSNKNFIWLIFLDCDTPTKYKNRMTALISKYSFIKTIYIDGMSAFSKSLNEIISSLKDVNSELVITTRMDNDDAIHMDFIKTIQELNNKKAGQVIDLRLGYQLDITQNKEDCRLYLNSFNPFISYIEKANDVHTVYSKMHKDWSLIQDITVYNKKPLWIEVVHENNKLNSVRRNFPMVWNPDFVAFGLKPNLIKRSRLYVQFNNLFVYIKKLIRSFIK